MKKIPFSIFFFLAALNLFASTVTLKDGETLSGEIVETTGDHIVLRYLDIPLTYYFDEIETIDGEPVKKKDSAPDQDIRPSVSSGLARPETGAGATARGSGDGSAGEVGFGLDQDLYEIILPVYLLKGMDYVYQGELDKAEDLFRKSLELDPRNEFYKRALKVLVDAKNGVIPRKAVPLLFEAEQYMFQRRPKEALSVLLRALQSTGKYDVTYYDLGVTYMLLEDFRRSVTYFQEVIDLNPGFSEAYFNLAHCFAMVYDFNDSVEFFWQGLRIDPANSIGWCGLGSSFSYLGYYKQAVICFNKGLEYDRSNPNGYFGLGIVYLKAGDRVRAKANFEKAGELFQAQGDRAALEKVNGYLKDLSQDR